VGIKARAVPATVSGMLCAYWLISQATGRFSWEGLGRVDYRKPGNLPSAGVADGKC